MEFKAEWTGGYPSLCVGEWKLYRRHNEYLDDGTIDIWYDDISNLIPEDLRHEKIIKLYTKHLMSMIGVMNPAADVSKNPVEI